MLWNGCGSKPTAQTSALAIALSNMKVQLRTRDTLALEYEVIKLLHYANGSVSGKELILEL